MGKIFLVGFMGSGKTFWGTIWARRKGVDFYDLDEIIVNTERMSVAEIFEKKGEAYFRNAETKALHSFTDKSNCIVACGGGAAYFNNNMEWMNNNGVTVYLSAAPEYILMRVERGKAKRPLISKLNNDELLVFIEQKLKEREFFYKQATFILPVNELNEDTLSKLTDKN